MAAILKLAVGDGRGFDRLNRSIVVLIPKRQDAIEVGDSGPSAWFIVLASSSPRLLPIGLEADWGSWKISTRRVKGVFLKLDISRAFDSLSWPFLFEVLRQMGFGEKCRKWLALLLHTASVKILVNGVPGKSIKIVRGL
ncbi:uncharacterized protein [Lolium perenne]|uniref:uncharacterized protein n=1 Tax=Lolium perenne TaxID=4522 RepID=UPI003A9A4BCB